MKPSLQDPQHWRVDACLELVEHETQADEQKILNYQRQMREQRKVPSLRYGALVALVASLLTGGAIIWIGKIVLDSILERLGR